MKKYLVGVLVMLGLGTAVFATPQASAVDLFSKCDSVDKTQCQLVKEDKLNYKGKNSIWGLIQFALGVLGGIAVIMIVIGGIKYATSGGDSSGVSSAKNTILYSVIGLVVALLAWGIVTLVITYFG
jgi:hypothetical protein